MLYFFPFRDEKQLLSGCPPLYQKKNKNKMQEQGIQDVVKRNKVKLEPCSDLVDQAFIQFNENSFNNQDCQVKLKMMKLQWRNISMKIPNFIPQILPDHEMEKDINSLNSKQREFFNVVHK